MGPIGEPFDLPVEGAAVLAVAGPSPLAVPVRAVNAWGAAVAADPLAITVAGAPVEVPLDAFGYGAVEITGAGAVRVAVGEVGVDALLLDGPVQGPALLAAVARRGAAIAVAPADDGALVATLDAVWFAGTDGRSWPVLAPVGSPLVGLSSGHLDRDGILDAVAWTSESVVLLRGRPGGGHAWLGGIRGLEVVGAAIGDTSGDGLPDVAIAWADGLDGYVEVWEAVGPEEWSPAPVIALPAVPVGVTVGDHAGLGVSQITVTDDDHGWTRLIRSAGGAYAVTGPSTSQISLVLEPGAAPFSGGDYDGDGAEELFVADPRVPLVERAVQVWDLFGTRPSTLRVGAVGAWLDVEDAAGNGFSDLWLLAESGDLTHLAYAEGLNARRPVGTLVDPGPLAARDQDGDGLAEVLVAGRAGWRWWSGRSVAGEGGPWWGPVAVEAERLSTNATPPLVTTDLDGSPATAEVAAFVVSGGVTEVRAWRFFAGSGSAPSEVGTATLGAGLAPVDLAACDGEIYALAGGILFRLGAGSTPLEVLADADADGQAVACGPGPSGSRVAVLDDGVVTLRDEALSFVASQNATGAVAVGLVGGGVVACEAEGCGVVGWTQGAGVVAVRTDATGTIVSGEPERRLPGTGALVVGDVDGDGREDLVSVDAGALVVHRWGGAIGPGEAWHTGEFASTLVVVDVTGDGAADPVWLDGAGAIAWPAPTSP